jgi:hypothetical protein
MFQNVRRFVENLFSQWALTQRDLIDSGLKTLLEMAPKE